MPRSHDVIYDRDDVWAALSWDERLEWVRDRLPDASRATVAHIAACRDVRTRETFIVAYLAVGKQED